MDASVQWSSSEPILTHCIHGLDLRLHPRCYLCRPEQDHPSDPAAPPDCGAYHPDHPGTRCRQPEGHSGEHATARLDVTWDNAYLSAPPSDPAATVCGACGHADPHVKNGGCGVDLMREGPPPYFNQCMCDGKSGSRIVRFWSAPPSDPAAPLGVEEATPARLDVERLARALENLPPIDIKRGQTLDADDFASMLAAEYAALRESQPEGDR